MRFLSILILLIFLGFCGAEAAETPGKWAGVDETVVEKYAREHGREPKPPVINTERGDLPLFLFLVSGAVGGFAAGYYWRMLTEKKRDKKEETERA